MEKNVAGILLLTGPLFISRIYCPEISSGKLFYSVNGTEDTDRENLHPEF